MKGLAWWSLCLGVSNLSPSCGNTGVLRWAVALRKRRGRNEKQPGRGWSTEMHEGQEKRSGQGNGVPYEEPVTGTSDWPFSLQLSGHCSWDDTGWPETSMLKRVHSLNVDRWELGPITYSSHWLNNQSKSNRAWKTILWHSRAPLFLPPPSGETS